jgi:hypothetical protein
VKRRALGDVVTELAAAIEPGPEARDLIRVTALDVDLPIEIELSQHDDELLLLADLPRWRWRSVFDRVPGRLSLQLCEELPQ